MIGLPRVVPVLISLVAGLLGASAQAEAVKRPNVIFFLVDDLGWSDLGCYGSSFYETPNIDRLAEEGVRFTQAYAACHVCSPTRASILTGKYPARLHLTDWLTGRKDFEFQRLKNAPIRQHLPFEEITLAEALKSEGYRTGIFGKWHLGEEPSGPKAHGFDVQVPRWNKGWPNAGYHAPFELEGLPGQKGDYLTDRLTDHAVEFIESNEDQPFFLYLSLFSVHDPIQGRADLVAKYQNKRAAAEPLAPPAFLLEGNPDDPEPPTAAQLAALADTSEYDGHRVFPRRIVKIKQHQDNIEFAAMVSAMDESLGRVRAKLEELGLAEDTIFIFFSDNGGMAAANFYNPNRVIRQNNLDRAYSTSNLPLRGAKGWLYEGGIRVPLIVHWPGRGKAGWESDALVISTDFFPTILEMTGLPSLPEQHADGISFTGALRGEPHERGPIFWHFPHYSNHGMQSPGGAVRLGRYKLLDYFENESVQLFDLVNDIGEQRDLSRELPEKADELRALLQVWREQVAANTMSPKGASE